MSNTVRFVTALTILLLAQPAAAELINYRFTGEVTVGGFGFNVGDPIEGDFTFDTNLPLDSTTADSATYAGVSPDSQVFAEGSGTSITEVGDFGASIEIENSVQDSVVFSITEENSFASPARITLIDEDGLAFSDTSIPIELNFDDFESAGLVMGTSPPFLLLLAPLSSLTRVPEPSTLALAFIAGLGALGWRWTRKAIKRSGRVRGNLCR